MLLLAFGSSAFRTTPAKGFDKVRIPGEPERESAAVRGANGIPIDDNSWGGILKAAEVAGMNASQIAELTS